MCCVTDETVCVSLWRQGQTEYYADELLLNAKLRVFAVNCSLLYGGHNTVHAQLHVKSKRGETHSHRSLPATLSAFCQPTGHVMLICMCFRSQCQFHVAMLGWWTVKAFFCNFSELDIATRSTDSRVHGRNCSSFHRDVAPMKRLGVVEVN